MPELTSRDIHGDRFRLSDHVQVADGYPPREPKPAFIMFGAHWCGPCKDMANVAQELLGGQVLRVFVHVDDVDRGEGRDADEILELARTMAREQLPDGYIVLQRGDGALMESWTGNTGLPSAILVGPDGRVFDTLGGFVEEEARASFTRFVAQYGVGASDGEATEGEESEETSPDETTN